MKLVLSSLPLLLLAASAHAQDALPAPDLPPAVLENPAGGQGGAVAAAEGAKWAVFCGQSGEGPCVIRQYLLSERDRRQVLMAGLLPAPAGAGATMRLVVPFGLDPTAPVAIGVDGQALASPPLRICLPAGCEAVVALDAEGLARLRRGTRMDVGLKAAGGGDLTLPVDLTGFSAAFDRASEGVARGEQAQ